MLETADELVVLLDEGGEPCGTAAKHLVHHSDTPLHLAFSCWIFDAEGRTLLTRRAMGKRTWPGAWTNSFCGHPGPGELVDVAVRRRAQQELGLTLDSLRLALPDFRYRAVMSDGTVENEICPVYLARPAGPPDPDPAEIDDLRWVRLDELRELVDSAPDEVSPWMALQLPEILSSGLATRS